MTIDLFIISKITPKQIIKQTNSFFNCPENNRKIVFSFSKHDFVIAIYNSHIRVSIAEQPTTNNDYYLLSKYITYIAKGKTLIITVDNKDHYYTDTEKINFEKMGMYL
ncbi:hypothetical protein D7V90_20640 [bacterium 1xD42-87]|nr:hypothetical protein D7V90_20640 [bacterium 1xD42-87]